MASLLTYGMFLSLCEWFRRSKVRPKIQLMYELMSRPLIQWLYESIDLVYWTFVFVLINPTFMLYTCLIIIFSRCGHCQCIHVFIDIHFSYMFCRLTHELVLDIIWFMQRIKGAGQGNLAKMTPNEPGALRLRQWTAVMQTASQLSYTPEPHLH